MERRPQLADVSQLTDQLWIGGELSASDEALARQQLDELIGLGITSIIDCRMECRDIDWVTDAKAQIDYLSIGVEDAGFLMPDEWWVDGTVFALGEFEDGQVVLSHCQAGINRGPSMGFAILLAQGWDPVDALDLIRSNRPIARIAYAEQACDWWLRSAGATESQRLEQHSRIMHWRVTNDVAGGADAPVGL